MVVPVPLPPPFVQLHVVVYAPRSVPAGAVSVTVNAVHAGTGTGPICWDWMPVLVPVVVAVATVVEPFLSVIVNWSVVAARPTTFFCTVKVAGELQLARSVLFESDDVVEEMSVQLVGSYLRTVVELPRKTVPSVLKAMPLTESKLPRLKDADCELVIALPGLASAAARVAAVTLKMLIELPARTT